MARPSGPASRPAPRALGAVVHSGSCSAPRGPAIGVQAGLRREHGLQHPEARVESASGRLAGVQSAECWVSLLGSGDRVSQGSRENPRRV